MFGSRRAQKVRGPLVGRALLKDHCGRCYWLRDSTLNVSEWSCKLLCVSQELQWKLEGRLIFHICDLGLKTFLFFFIVCWLQAVQQNIPGQRQLWPDVLWTGVQPVLREAGGALPLQVPLVLLRHLQEMWADRRAIRLQMSPRLLTATPAVLHMYSATPGSRLTKALQIQRRLNPAEALACVSLQGTFFFSCISIIFVSDLPAANQASSSSGWQTWMWRAWCVSRIKWRRRPHFFFLFCHVNENTFPSPGILKVYFIMSIKRNYIEFYDGGEDFLFSSLETFFYSMELEVSGGTMWYFF